MAETTYKLRPSLKTLSQYVVALEEISNTTCLKNLPRTLVYKGTPTDPKCIELMEKVLQLYPEDPVGICIRDGIEAPSCTSAYGNQETVAYDSSLADADLPDPALKVGLSKPEVDRLEFLQQTLAELDGRYRSATTPPEKHKLVMEASEAYDQALTIACRVSAMSLVKKDDAIDPSSDYEILALRKRLLELPPSVREDHQGKMILDIEKKLRTLRNNPQEELRQREILRVLQNLEKPPTLSTASLRRIRYVLPACGTFIAHASAAMPEFPSPICHKTGWYSPACITALKNWGAVKALRASAAQGTPASGLQKNSVISTF
jgi:hypothetical protein